MMKQKVVIRQIDDKKHCSQYKFQMQKSKHKLESKQKFNYQNNKQTIETNYETIETQYDRELYSMKNVKCPDLQMSPQRDIIPNEEEIKSLKNNDSVHLEIELDDGKVQIIKPNIYDDPYLLAKKFCSNNQLDQQMVPILAANIQKTIQKLIKTTIVSVNQNKNLKDQTKKNNRINTQPSINNRQNIPSQIISKNKSPSKHFQSISKQFQKKKISPQKIAQNHNKSSSINARNHTIQLKNQIDNSFNDRKFKFQSKKKQPQYHSVKTQKSLKTEPNQPLKNKASPFILINKENHSQSTFFDYLPQNSRKQNQIVKNKQKLEGFMRRNCGFSPQINKNSSQKNMNNKSIQSRKQNRKSGSKDSLKKTFTRSIDYSIDSEGKQVKSGFNQNKRSPLVNYSLVNLSTNNSQGRPIYHRKQTSNSILQNPTSSTQHILQTHRLYESQKQKAFKSIFSLLDDDCDGVISIVNINLVQKIQQRLIQVLFPVLQQMQILQTELNEQEFTQAMQKLFVKLSVEQKGYLLKYYNRQQQEQNKKSNNVFNQNQPKMSPISQELVNQTQRRNVTVYQYSKIREQQKNKKLEKQRIQKEKVLMRNCTFHPKVNSKKIIYF